jgi:cytochrome b involved in lipid metabolism
MSERLTYTEVAAHRKQNDYYIVIHEKVYDISKFLEEHP